MWSEDAAQKDLSSLGITKQPGSGNYIGRKGDLSGEHLLGEVKETKTRVLEVETAWLRKITREAREDLKIPFFVMGFPNMSGAVPKLWGCLPLPIMTKLIEAAGWDALMKEDE